MKAYLEQTNKIWFDDFVYISLMPLMDRGIEVVPFDELDADDFFARTVFSKQDILIGSVEATNMFFDALDVDAPTYIGYPEELNEFYGRKIYKTTFGERPKEYPYFLKPANDIKLFTGSLVENDGHIDIIKNWMANRPIEDSLEMYISEPIDFVSEYRCFVLEQNLVGMKHYQGDFTVFPNVDVVNQIMNTYSNCPVAYTIDVGVTSTGETCIVELNDFWAIGSYGLDGNTYVIMLIRRFHEIMNK